MTSPLGEHRYAGALDRSRYERSPTETMIEEEGHRANPNNSQAKATLSTITSTTNGYHFKVEIPPILLAPNENNYFPSGFVHCVVVRDVKDDAAAAAAASKTVSRFNFIFQTNTNGKDKVAIVASRQKGNLTSNFHFFDLSRTGGSSSALSSLELDKKSGNYIGKLRRLKKEGTSYSLYNSKEDKEEIGAFMYDMPSVLKQMKEGQPPRKLKMAIPHVDKKGAIEPMAPYLKNRMIDSLKRKNSTGMHTFVTKEPSHEEGQYRLNFGGRVSVPSVKNMQILDDHEEIVMQFGKVGEHRFHLDYK